MQIAETILNSHRMRSFRSTQGCHSGAIVASPETSKRHRSAAKERSPPPHAVDLDVGDFVHFFLVHGDPPDASQCVFLRTSASIDASKKVERHFFLPPGRGANSVRWGARFVSEAIRLD